MEVLNVQDPTQETDFGTSRGRKVFHFLKRIVRNKYPKVLRILVPPEILVPSKFLHNLRGTPYVQLNILPNAIHKSGLNISDPVTISNFPEKLSQSKYICAVS